MLLNGPIVNLFNRHLVPMFITLKRNSTTHQFTITAFVLSVDDEWFLVTAGHCLRDIDMMKSDGYSIHSCALIDSVGIGGEYHYSIPFAYDNASPVYLSDNLEYDYGIIPLSLYYRQLLEAKSVVAINEEAWESQPPSYDFFKLIGIPYELLEITEGYIKIISTLIDIEVMDELPEGIPVSSTPQFFGKIRTGEVLSNIAGISGGPIFGFHRNPIGQLRYWLVALQSRWIPSKRIIIGCPTRILGQFLKTQTR